MFSHCVTLVTFLNEPTAYNSIALNDSMCSTRNVKGNAPSKWLVLCGIYCLLDTDTYARKGNSSTNRVDRPMSLLTRDRKV